MHFAKMHGCGNSFVVVDDRRRQIGNAAHAARVLCDSRFGIGADGLILVRRRHGVDFRMDYFNKDGSAGEMCGNGIRCLAKYVFDRKLSDKRELRISTGAGVVVTRRNKGRAGAAECSVTVDMGEPRFSSPAFRVRSGSPAQVKIGRWTFACVSMGNPHAVSFVRSFDFDLEREGSAVEGWRDVFPKGTNVEFIKVLSQQRMRMRVWERGAGLTLACGTGACAGVVAAVQLGVVGRDDVEVQLDGGTLSVNWDIDSNHVFMTGPAFTAAEGVFEAALLKRK